MNPAYSVIDIARQYDYIREAQSLGQNQGQRVNAIQMWSGGREALGTSWCAWMATLWLDIAYKGQSPIPRMGSCEQIRKLADQRGWLREKPSAGDLYLYLNDSGVAHHVGIVTNNVQLTGISGNTSAPDAEDSANGDRVAEKRLGTRLGRIVFVHYQD